MIKEILIKDKDDELIFRLKDLVRSEEMSEITGSEDVTG